MCVILLPSVQAKELRCGWFFNPTPANAYLIDRHGWWPVGVQGGHQAIGAWPTLPQMVKTNVNYGYGCACLLVTTKQTNYGKVISEVHSAKGLPLRNCRTDKTLPSEFNITHTDY